MENLNTQTKAWINLMAFLISLGVNALGALGQFNGMSQKAISDKYHTLITPAPITFSIWSIIYLLLLITLIVMIIKAKDKAYKKMIDILSPIFLISCFFNMLWIVSFSYEKIGISTLLIFGLLFSLTTINKKLLQHKREIPYRLASITFGLYAGWVTIATVVNIASYLVSISWNGLGIDPIIWAPMTLIISLVIVTAIKMNLKNALYSLPVAWAFFGILMEIDRLADPLNYGPYMKPVIMVGIFFLLYLSIKQFKQNNYDAI